MGKSRETQPLSIQEQLLVEYLVPARFDAQINDPEETLEKINTFEALVRANAILIDSDEPKLLRARALKKADDAQRGMEDTDNWL
ncbi:MAG TPA: hypothetical protein VG895_01150 [Patescibacteria group bacterium]|nr:hypothetical protein [Patescibacteria group bacterium]